MATTNEAPIWDVIEEFKEKVKTQELELKNRREKVHALEAELEKRKAALEELAQRLDAQEKDMRSRLGDLVPREKAVLEEGERLRSRQAEIRRREEEVQRSRVELERRQADITRREESITTLANRSSEYESGIRAMGERVRGMEAALIQEQEKARQMLDELSALRESLLAKGKVLADQEALLAEGRRIVLEEQKRFVGREKALNEREESIARRTSERPPEPVEEVAEEEEIRPEPVKVEPVPEPAPTPEAAMAETTVEDASELAKEKPPTEEEEPTPIFKAAEAKAEDEEPETPVFRAENKPDEAICPHCHVAVPNGDEKCPSCGHPSRDATAPDRVEKGEQKDGPQDEPKRAVSIRKIIRRK